MGKPFVSSQAELARYYPRDSLDIFGRTPIQEVNSSRTAADGHRKAPLFSRTPGSAWEDALQAAEMLLQGTKIPSSARSSTVTVGKKIRAGPPPDVAELDTAVEPAEFSLDDLIIELEEAEKNSKESPAEWEGVLTEIQTQDDHGEQQRRGSSSNGYERRGRRSSDSFTRSQHLSGVSDEVISERAAQWGYGVVLKNSSRESTPRTSTGSSSGANGGTQAIPGVSKDVKDALSSFQLAFLVCDATHEDYPILYGSAGFTTMTGYTADETVGRNCRFLQGPDTDRSELGKIRVALKKGGIYTGTLLNYKKDGTPFWNLLTISPIKDDDGKVIKYIGMQAEQTSKEQQPRNSKGQKSPIVKHMQAPSSSVRDVEKQKAGVRAGAPAPAAAAPTAHRRHSSSSLPRPPIAPLRASNPGPAPPDRHSSGPELQLSEHQQRRTSQRYSLTSNPPRSSRNSSVVAEPLQHDWRDAALGLKIGVEPGKKSSFFDTPETSATSESSSQKSKNGKLTSRFLRLFRKDSRESKRSLETVPSGKEVFELSDSEEEKDEFADYPARNSESRRYSSNVYSPPRSSGSQTRPDGSADDLSDRLRGRVKENNGGERQSSTPPPPPFSGKQFCIVHT
uniref:Putative LOV domain-containing protein n=1 Tax=Schistochila sp. BC-2016 TaxID=1799626 RepID=A0A126WZ22_9MARC|nr:putative LOV domain-containing protein [Schistochila sp. BC-2016]